MNIINTLNKFEILKGTEFCGKLKKSLSFTDEPKIPQYNCSYGKEGVSAGISFNKNLAKVKALGEAVERYCLDNPNKKFVFSSYKNFKKKNAINPLEFVNFRDQETNFKKEIYSKKLEESVFAWTEAIDIQNNEKIFVPAQLVYINYPFNEPVIRPRISTGAATGKNTSDAFLGGLLECVERDSFMINYLSKKKLPKMKLEGKFKKIEDYFKRYLLEINVFETTTNTNIPSFMCINLDKTGFGPAVSVGLKAGLNMPEAILGSILESQQVRKLVRYSYIAEGMPKINKKEQIIDTKERGYFWYNKNKIKKLDFLLKNPKEKRIKDIKNVANSLEDILKIFNFKKIKSYYVDITHQEINDAGFKVIKTIIPELHPLYLDERFPCLYSKRLNNVLKGKKINNIPHPFL